MPEWLLVLVLIAAPLAIGGVHLATRLALGGVTFVAFVWAAQRLAREQRVVRVGLFGWALGVALVVTFLQLVPLPAGLVHALSPASYDARATAASIAAQATPDWMPLSLDQARTAAAFVSLLTVTLVYLTTTSLRSDSSVTARLTIAVEVAALAVLVVGVVQELLGLHAIFGSYAASTDLTQTPFLTTFVNPNHAAALFVLGSLVAFGASLASDRAQRWHLPVGVALGLGVLVTLSRANALLLVAGLLALTIPPLFAKRHRDLRPRLLRLLIGAICCLFVGIVLIGPERWLSEMGSLGSVDLAHNGLVRECWRTGLEMTLAAPALGVGNGAFGLAAAAHTRDWDIGLMTFSHNGALQTTAELGLPLGGLVLLLVIGAFVLGLVRARHDLPTWGAVVALGALMVQNLVDFSLWIPGVGIPAAAVAGIVILNTWPEGKRRWLDSAWRWPLAASAALLGLLIVVVPIAWRDRPDAAGAAARAALVASDPSLVDRRELAAQHPHDFVVLALAGALADRAGQRAEAMAWAERALVLAPSEPSTLGTAVRIRLADNDAAGAATLVEAIDLQGHVGRRAALELVLAAKTSPAGGALMERYFGADVTRSVQAAGLLVERGELAAAKALLRWSMEHHPDDPVAAEALAARSLDSQAAMSELASHALAKAGLVEDPALRRRWSWLGYYLQGRAELGAGHQSAGWLSLMAAADEASDVHTALGTDRVAALIDAGKAASAMGRAELLDDVLERLRRLTIEGGWPLGEYHFLLSRKAELAGDLTLAIREMHEALRQLGQVVAYHDRIADLFYRAHDPDAGARARARARALEKSPR